MFGSKKKGLIAARKLETMSNAKSIISEQFRTIRTNITFATPDQPLQTVLITSTIPGEGKSTNAANLSVVFAQEGKRVLLVDADMRKPTLHYTFALLNAAGLSTVLARKHTLQEAIQETPIVGLSILPSGPIPPNPAELLSSLQMQSVMADLKSAYDLIIFDTPPVLSVTDAQILSNLCDGTLLIVQASGAEKEAVLKAKALLLASQATILGVVLNQYKMPRNEFQYYQHYGMGEGH